MQVYCVVYGYYEESGKVMVFDSLKLAENYKATLGSLGKLHFDGQDNERKRRLKDMIGEYGFEYCYISVNKVNEDPF